MSYRLKIGTTDECGTNRMTAQHLVQDSSLSGEPRQGFCQSTLPINDRLFGDLDRLFGDLDRLFGDLDRLRETAAFFKDVQCDV